MNNKTSINGSGVLNGGEYKDISISGSGKITGDIVCENLDISGSCKSEGFIDAKKIRTNGSFKSETGLNAELITINGSMAVNGDIKANKLYVNGSLKSDHVNIYAEYLEINGGLSNGKELNADRLVVNGKLNANEVVGTSIEIGMAHNLDLGSFLRFSSHAKLLNKAESITCETLCAKYLKCNKICADEITLKGNCNIEYIECSKTLFIGRNCKVEHIEGECEIIRE